jgi:hypothetical protein
MLHPNIAESDKKNNKSDKITLYFSLLEVSALRAVANRQAARSSE